MKKQWLALCLAGVLLAGCGGNAGVEETTEKLHTQAQNADTSTEAEDAGTSTEKQAKFESVVINRFQNDKVYDDSLEKSTGKLTFTVENARLVTDLPQAGLPTEGFLIGQRILSIYLDESGEKLLCLNEDGTLQEGYYLAVLDITCENVDYMETGTDDPYLLRMDKVFLMLYDYGLPENNLCFKTDYNYFRCDAAEDPENSPTVHLEPGQKVFFQMGYLFRDDHLDTSKLLFETNGSSEDGKIVEVRFGL